MTDLKIMLATETAIVTTTATRAVVGWRAKRPASPHP